MAKTANGNEGEIWCFCFCCECKLILLLLWMQVPNAVRALPYVFVVVIIRRLVRFPTNDRKKNRNSNVFFETTKKSKIHTLGRFLYCIYYFLLFLVLLKTMARRQFSLFLLLPNSSKTNWNRQQQQQLQKVTQRNNQKITDWSWTNCVSYKKSAGRYTILCCDYYNCVSVVVGGVIDEMLMIIFMLIRRFRKGEGVNE